MRYILKPLPLFFILLFISLVLLNIPDSSFSADNPKLLAGAAKVNITPEENIPINWHSAKNRPRDGIHDEVFSRAIVFSDGTNRVAVISVDVSGFSDSVWDELTKLIEKETGIPQDHIMLCATHNHSGPSHNLGGRRKNASQEVENYTIQLKNNIVKSAKDAKLNLKPVSIGSGKGECKMNINRCARLAVGGRWLGKNPDGPCDHEVAVLKIDDLHGNINAIFINWPCHGTVMGSEENNYLTGDWPGATALFVEKEFGNKIVAPVTAGASGDIDPIMGPHGVTYSNVKMTNSDIYGILVGEEVIKVAKEIKTYSNGYVAASQRTVSLPGKKSYRQMNIPFSEVQKLNKDNFVPDKDVILRLSAIKVGNVIFAGISGELFNEIGSNLKKQSPYTSTFILTHCNGSCGYIPTDKAYFDPSYEVVASRIMSGAEQAIMKNLIEMINDL